MYIRLIAIARVCVCLHDVSLPHVPTQIHRLLTSTTRAVAAFPTHDPTATISHAMSAITHTIRDTVTHIALLFGTSLGTGKINSPHNGNVTHVEHYIMRHVHVVGMSVIRDMTCVNMFPRIGFRC